MSVTAQKQSAPLIDGSIEVLNSDFFCISLDTDALRAALESKIGQPGLFDLAQQRCPRLFAARPVFLSRKHTARLTEQIDAIESVVALPAYREEVLAVSPAIARHDPHGAERVFFGCDFHAAENGFGLIEINTNAGGAMLNAVPAGAQLACCPAMAGRVPPPATADALEAGIVAMFRREWNLSGHEQPLRSGAIVVETPEQQCLYPEFVLFQQLFQRNGLQAAIAGPTGFGLRDDVYDGAVQWVAARLYQGQTTNFRTPGGGFAPVYAGSLPSAAQP